MSASSLLQLVDDSLVRRAGQPALEVDQGERPPLALRFDELEARSNRMARALAARGLRKGDRLAVQLGNRLEFLDLFLGAQKLGLVFLPVNVLYREREVGHIVADASPAAVVTTSDLAALVPPGTSTWDVDALAAEAAAQSAERPRVDVADLDPAAILYTSGTTGRAKGAVLLHANLAANARALVAAWRITAEDRYLAVLPLFHVHGLANGVLCWLASGCLARLAPRFEHERALSLFESFRPTLFFGVPTVYVRLLALPEEAARAIGARTRLFVSGSAPLPPSVFAAFRERFSHAILERYGMTETLMTIGNPYGGERRPGTVGLPFAGVSIRIVDGSGRDVPDGEAGELWVKGPTVFSGYWRRPDATGAAFVDGWFRTGDLASRAPDGYVTLRGRASELILCGGFNVYPREIEDVLVEQPGVREAAVVGVPDERRGERPVAYFAGDADKAALEAACRAQLASFKVPAAFVRVDALPRNALGKVEKKRLG